MQTLRLLLVTTIALFIAGCANLAQGNKELPPGVSYITETKSGFKFKGDWVKPLSAFDPSKWVAEQQPDTSWKVVSRASGGGAVRPLGDFDPQRQWVWSDGTIFDPPMRAPTKPFKKGPKRA